jgi:hydrogenase maturation protein HypF
LAESMMERGINVPTCSSAGRLFDAVAAALGLHADRISHEGQAAMALEALARPFAAEERPWRTVTGLDWGNGGRCSTTLPTAWRRDGLPHAFT